MEQLLTVEQLFSIADLLKHIENGYQNPAALNTFNNGTWETHSSVQMVKEVKYLALALQKAGLKRGEKVGIMGPPSSRWTIADLAIMAAGGVSVPLFQSISEENLRFEVTQTELTKVFIGGTEAWSRYHQTKDLYQRVISLDSGVDGSVENFEELLHAGKTIYEQNSNAMQDLLAQVRPEDLATIIYTSGTTGQPKGVMHTHFSLFAPMLMNDFSWDPKNDRYLSFLPVAHIFARIINLIAVTWSVAIYYYNDIKTLGSACQEVHPTVMIVVPRLLEKIYASMVARLHKQSYLKRTIGQFAFDLANQDHETIWTQLFHPLAEKLVYSHLREALGNCLRIVCSGSAPLDPHLYHFYVHIGIPLFEGYGSTEICPVAANRKDMVKIGTVGKTLGLVDVKISPKGELLLKGFNLMVGYYKNPEATEAVIDSDGWFHTGDLAAIDSEGYIKITGRLKELLKTSTGETIAPIPIEHALAKIPFIEQAMVIAEKKKYATCLLVPNFDVLHALKSEHHASQMSDEQFLQSEYIKNEMEKFLSHVNDHLNQWEKIRDYRFIPHELGIDKGELTPTMKMVRSVIEMRYQGLIDSMYRDNL